MRKSRILGATVVSAFLGIYTPAAFTAPASGRDVAASDAARAGDATCTAKPGTPIAPPDPSAAHWRFHDVVVYKNYLQIFFYDNSGEEKRCVAIEEVSLAEFYSNKQTQDIVGQARVVIPADYAVPNSLQQMASDRQGPVAPAKTIRSIFVVAIAVSSFNDDKALLVAAAKLTADPADLAWKLFRIQLTKVSDNTHFCVPSANDTVLAPRVGSAAGRLFVAFDSYSDDFTTTGSILDLDAQALLGGGPAKIKCFRSKAYAGVAPPDVRDGSKRAYFLAAPLFSNVIKRFRLKIASKVKNDSIAATADISVTPYALPPGAVQPNGVRLDAGSSAFRVPSVQIGNALWNVHTIDGGNNHPKVRFYKFSATGKSPAFELTLGTLGNKKDDLFAPSLAIEPEKGGEAFITFTRTIANNAAEGRATLMLARGPKSSVSGWKYAVLAKSPGQISKNSFGAACDPFVGCQYGPDSATVIDSANGIVRGFGETIAASGASEAGSEKNWIIKGIARPK